MAQRQRACSITGIEALPVECASEMKAEDRNCLHTLLVTREPTGLSRIISCERYGSLPRLLRVTARVLRFIDILKRRIRKDSTPYFKELGSEEINAAKTLWIKESQRPLVSDKKFESWKQQFGLFLDDAEVWRCGGRLSNAAVPYTTKHPILLGRDHHLTMLLVCRAHERVFHDGTKETLAELRTRYWIIKGRSFVRKVIHQCVTCRKFEGKPCPAPPPPPLPRFRVEEEPPFTNTGVDFAGPMYVKSSEPGRSKKVWLCLYTCCPFGHRTRYDHSSIPSKPKAIFCKKGPPANDDFRQRKDL